MSFFPFPLPIPIPFDGNDEDQFPFPNVPFGMDLFDDDFTPKLEPSLPPKQPPIQQANLIIPEEIHGKFSAGSFEGSGGNAKLVVQTGKPSIQAKDKGKKLV